MTTKCLRAHKAHTLTPEQLIDLIINHDYWEIIDVQTIIMMSISYVLSKEIATIRN